MKAIQLLKQTFFVVVLTLTFINLLSCATSPTGRSQLHLLPDSQLDAMGVQSFQDMKTKIPLEREAKTNKYVKCIADAIVIAMNGDPNQWEVIVFKNDEPNAFALPGKKIGVHTGILKVAKNQHQFAAVMGHEVGHVLAKHGNERVSQNLATQVGLTAASVATSDSKNGRLLMAGLGLGANVGILLPFSRAQETEADEIGLNLMADAGFDPSEAPHLWANMKSAGAGGSPEFLSTHPAPENRIENLKRLQNGAVPRMNQARRSGRNPNCI